MKKLLAVIILFVLMHGRLLAQTTPLPYYESFDTGGSNFPVQQLGWTTYNKGAANSDLAWYATIHNPYTEPNALTYTCGGATMSSVIDQWCVTPVFAFPFGGKIDSLRSYSYGGAIPGNADTIAIYLLKGSPDPALATSRQLLYDFRGANYSQGNWNKVMNLNIPAMSGNCYIAFRYKVLNNCLSLFVDNLHISGNVGNKISSVYKSGQDFTVGPNPVTGKLSITTKKDFVGMKIYDAAGKKVFSGTYLPVINTEAWPAGIYFLELTDKNQNKGVTQFIKQ